MKLNENVDYGDSWKHGTEKCWRESSALSCKRELGGFMGPIVKGTEARGHRGLTLRSHVVPSAQAGTNACESSSCFHGQIAP